VKRNSCGYRAKRDNAMKLIVGLGNPGWAFSHNRHNVGFMCLNRFARAHHLSFDKARLRARTATGEVDSTRVILARPQVFINLSGEVVASLARRFNIPPADVLVICDDLDLPIGRIRIRKNGGSGGHKGLKSIISQLGSGEFPRIRVGIGRPTETEVADEAAREEQVINYVLSDFTSAESRVIGEAAEKVAWAIYCILTDGLEAAMNEYNRADSSL
jgi:PTH1 family peptidyl-tRNA hydrolase